MTVAAISTYIGQFFSGEVDASTPHLVLILAAVIGGIAVGIGIIWEGARGGHLWTLPTLIVVLGVVVEAGATVILLEFDESISRSQQSKIVMLETRIAQRELTDDQIKALEDACAAVPASVLHNVVFSYLMGDQESAYFAYEIGRYFMPSWHVDLEVRSYVVLLTWGITVNGPDNATTRAVKDMLNAAGLSFSTDALPSAFQAYGHKPVFTDTLVFIGPKGPTLSPAEAARAGVK